MMVKTTQQQYSISYMYLSVRRKYKHTKADNTSADQADLSAFLPVGRGVPPTSVRSPYASWIRRVISVTSAHIYTARIVVFTARGE